MFVLQKIQKQLTLLLEEVCKIHELLEIEEERAGLTIPENAGKKATPQVFCDSHPRD